ncbi:7141_t:CDS:2 [Cetraspora pellucida]|uniref:7141_t:CDS:1 n=1 Tax=Cetraspora pellucida TaxID=1433469 RepID=A0A9N9K184_9GLOM|nr:7141_t:CDS:2 [Cetraspora pellucida]
MGRTRKKAVPIRRGAQHTLPSIELAEKQTNTPSISSSSSVLSTSSIFSSTQMRSNTLTAKHVVIESRLDGSDDNDGDLHDPDISSNNKNPISPIDDDILENNWHQPLQDAIGEAIYAAIEKTKYPTDEHLMKICYDTLLDIKEVDFQNTIHSEFLDLVKPKTGNRQVTHEEERKFKEANITKESYLKLNQPVDANDDPHYTYLNLIIDHTFADPNTEKNFIAFGMAVALNYLDSSKGISMVPSEVTERMNHILEKMQVPDHKEL